MNNKKIEQEIYVPDTSELERQVLADAINSPSMLGEVIPLLHVDFFTSNDRKHIWKEIIDHYNKGKNIDLYSISSVTGEPFNREILPMVANAGGTVTCVQHANLLRTQAAKRRAYYASAYFMTEAVKPDKSEADILASLTTFNAQVEGPAPLLSEKKLDKALEKVKVNIKEEEEMLENGETMRIRTGFHFLDMAINNGFKPGQLIILAARPSVGKTAVMLQMAKTAAQDGNPVEIMSLEMTADELCERLLYSTGKVMPHQITFNKVNWAEYDEAETSLKQLPIYINDFSRTLDDIVYRLTQAVKQGRCKIAFIDYLGLIQDALNFGNAKLYQVIAKITGTLKAVAKNLRIPIVLLCQLNREQAREKRAPELFDLRDSGSIEQDSDIVIMLEPKPEDKTILAWLRKNRSGKRDLAYVLKPNSTFSAFEEESPISPVKKVEVPEDIEKELDLDIDDSKHFNFYR